MLRRHLGWRSNTAISQLTWLGLTKKDEKRETNTENYRSDKGNCDKDQCIFGGENTKKGEELFKVVQKRDGEDDGIVRGK